ncbi:hypothetical protein K469DRAFT_585622 [Zopfia rhizophila CBS 207.26]|uniref:Heterokaryon incompatibility domain-containing protein n=1 Tax=Zopfia rhizophila CBS 207.26 TaxID=1314779 RepID=A0A6A6DXF2_9PEZI|nr:hypothetical protein K469DRAFT_585622 [Zopfia rhizophila CBS 207.26]
MKLWSQSLAHYLSQHKPYSLRKEDDWIPTRLFNIHATSSVHDSIRVVERRDVQATAANTKIKYLALSHVWGSTPDLMLTKTNYSDMTIGIRIGLLP